MEMDDKISTENHSHVTNIAPSFRGYEIGEKQRKSDKEKMKKSLVEVVAILRRVAFIII